MRLIDADALDVVLRNEAKPFGYGVYDCGITDGLALARDCAETAPTIDAVPVARCWECKYSDTYPEEADNEMPLKCLGIRYGGVYPDWYCEHGQRREGGDNVRSD